MIKLAYGNGVVYVSLTSQEFSGLAGESYSSVSDGTDISLVELKQKVDLVDSKNSELASLKSLAQDIVTSLNSIGI